MVLPSEVLEAVTTGDISVVVNWLESGGDPAEVGVYIEDSPWFTGSLLTCAIMWHDVGRGEELCAILIEQYGARCRPEDLWRAVHVFENPGFPISAATAEMFLSNGADAARTNQFQYTLLHKMGAFGQAGDDCAALIPVLIAHGARINARVLEDRYGDGEVMVECGNTPLMEAVCRQDFPGPYRASLDVVRQLLRYGADPDAVTQSLSMDTNSKSPHSYTRDYTGTSGEYLAVANVIASVRGAGSWKRYVLEPRQRMLLLRKLVERRRAVAPRRGVLARLFPASAHAQGVPDVIFWKIMSFWRTSRDVVDP